MGLVWKEVVKWVRVARSKKPKKRKGRRGLVSESTGIVENVGERMLELSVGVAGLVL